MKHVTVWPVTPDLVRNIHVRGEVICERERNLRIRAGLHPESRDPDWHSRRQREAEREAVNKKMCEHDWNTTMAKCRRCDCSKLAHEAAKHQDGSWYGLMCVPGLP